MLMCGSDEWSDVSPFRGSQHNDHPARKQAASLLNILFIRSGKKVHQLEPLFVSCPEAHSR